MSNMRWGNWELRVEIMCIEHSVNGYQISLDECLTSAAGFLTGFSRCELRHG